MSVRSIRTVFVATLVAMLIAAGLGVATPTTRASGGVSPSKLGMYVGFDQAGRFAQMEQRLGQPIKWVLTMADKKSPSGMTSSAWGQLAKPGAYLPTVSDRVNLIMSVPLGFGRSGVYEQNGGREAVRRNLVAVSSGQYDPQFRQVARYLIDAGFDDAILRLGHEFDGTWEPYTARENEAAYIAAYRHVHDVFAKESSGFRFEWTSMRAHFSNYGPPAYPGDQYVDIVGLDIYYRGSAPITDLVWQRQYASVLTAHRDFAAARGKPVSYSEWGRGMADHSKYIDLMHGWLSSLADEGPGGLVYHSYFNEKVDDYDLEKMPTVQARYIALFGRGGTTTPVTTATTPTAPAAPVTTATAPTTAAPPIAPGTTVTPPTNQQPSTTTAVLEPARRNSLAAANVTTAGTATTPTVTLTPAPNSLGLVWSHVSDAPRANVRYRRVGSTKWEWVANGGGQQQLTGLIPSTLYEVQVRIHLQGQWQEWTTVRASTLGPA